ncbi:hypothetical protein [Mycobacterium uberis]|uniref:hypothetical protein n=1 Tax=Mycobacterium uberis TaxID=2162698 RepID=UPI000E3086F8|nr:hypothetical protein [Mycobacterium uberis]
MAGQPLRRRSSELFGAQTHVLRPPAYALPAYESFPGRLGVEDSLSSVKMYEDVVTLMAMLHFVFFGYVIIGSSVTVHWWRTIWLYVPVVIGGIGIATNYVDFLLIWLERWARVGVTMALRYRRTDSLPTT